MSILVTGGLGFIGHNLVKKLQEQNNLLSIIDSQTNYNSIPEDHYDFLNEERKKKIEWDGVYAYKTDILNIEEIDNIFNIEQPEICVHLAGFPRVNLVDSNPLMARKVMINGLINILEMVKKHEVRKFIFLSSSMVYGNFNDNVEEDSLCNPNTLYGVLKFAGEHIIKEHAKTDNFSYTIIRPTAVYGPLDVNDRIVGKLFNAAKTSTKVKINDLNQKLDFTYVDDLVDGLIAAIFSDNTENKIYNLSKGNSRAIIDAAQIIANLVGKNDQLIEENYIKNTYPNRGSLNISKAQRDFNYSSSIEIEEGLRKYYEYIINTPFWN